MGELEREYARLSGIARDAAEAAAGPIRHYYRGGANVRYKEDDSPVTAADEAAEAAIREVLRAACPDHGIYGEEGGAEGLDKEWLWLVDPIDGTKGFVRGDPLFSTQIALMHRGELVLGVSSASEFGELAWAWRGGGAWLNGERLHCSATDSFDRTILSFGNIQSLAADPRRWQAVGSLVQRVHRHRGYGDFLHYHRLAQGRIDAVVESDLNILDIAALAVIVTEAGGVMTDLEGQALNLKTRSIVAGCPAMHPQILEALRG